MPAAQHIRCVRTVSTSKSAPYMARRRIKVKLTPNALPPTRGSSMAAGLDLKSAYNVTIPAYGKGVVETDLAILVPPGCYGRIAPR